jgi:23S rRNA (cytosine1962-C5)-methyltransferase
MPDPKLTMFANRLKKVDRLISKQAKREGISCFRMYDRDLPEFPLIIDRYKDHVLITEYRSNHRLSEEEYEAWLDSSIQTIKEQLQVSDELLHIKERKRKEGRTDQYQRLDAQRAFITVQEGGLQFLVNLNDYLDTGLFLDHRITRDKVRKESKGKRVLNLFAYTGSFSVYAASGGAQEIITVDLSNTYLQWAKENMVLNGFSGEQYRYVRADVLQWLNDCPAASVDLIVLDPPTFSNSKMMKTILDIQEMHVDLINTCLSKLRIGGVIFFSTNARKFQLDADHILGTIEDITAATTPFDFKGKLLRWCYRISTSSTSNTRS